MRTIDVVMAEMAAIVEGAESRSLTDEEITAYEALEVELRGLQRSAEIQKRHAAYNAVDTSIQAVAHAATPKADDGLERAFDAFLRTGIPNQDLTQLRAQGEGVGPEGGYLVPDGFRQKIVERMKAFGGIAGIAEEVSTSTGAPLPWITVDDTANTGEVVAENGTFVGGADIEFGTVSLGAHKYMAGGAGGTPLRVSVELLQDAAFDVQGLITRKLGERLARTQAPHLATGTGVNQPKGLVHGKTGIEIAADGDGITYKDLLTFIHSLDPAYRANARWVFNDNTLELLRGMEDAAGDPLWREDSANMATSLGGGVLMGYPVTIDQAMPDFVAASNTVNWGAFGDINAGYVIRRVKATQLVVNPWTRASNGQVEFTAWARMDAVPQDVNAYIALTGEQ